MRYQQLQLFTRPATAAMRDRTKARNYSPEKEEFRRDHARRRQWGLARRHAQKLCRSHGCSRECAEVGLHDHAEAVPPLIWPAEATSRSGRQRRRRTEMSRPAMTCHATSSTPAGQQPQRAPKPPAGPDPHPRPAGQTEPLNPNPQAGPSLLRRPKPHAGPKSPDRTRRARSSRCAGADQHQGAHRQPPEAVTHAGPGHRPTPARSATSGRTPPTAPHHPIRDTSPGPTDAAPPIRRKNTRMSPKHKTTPNKKPTTFPTEPTGLISRRRRPRRP